MYGFSVYLSWSDCILVAYCGFFVVSWVVFLAGSVLGVDYIINVSIIRFVG